MTTYWNFQHAKAQKVRVIVGDSGFHPGYWARHLVGQEREAVKVTYGSWTFYLDNEDGSGWRKVTEGKGSPRWPHRNLEVQGLVTNDTE